MAEFLDFQFKESEFGLGKEYKDEDAIVLAIRNILLSRPGNFPFNPSIGMNIKKYQFDFIDDETLEEIKGELSRQISRYIPSLANVNIFYF